MRSHEAAALAVLQSTFGEPVSYHGAGLTGGSVTAIRSDVPGDPYEGLSGRKRRVIFEIPTLSLPDKPSKIDRIVEADETEWKVIDITHLSDVGAWSLVVERS